MCSSMEIVANSGLQAQSPSQFSDCLGQTHLLHEIITHRFKVGEYEQENLSPAPTESELITRLMAFLQNPFWRIFVFRHKELAFTQTLVKG